MKYLATILAVVLLFAGIAQAGHTDRAVTALALHSSVVLEYTAIGGTTQAFCAGTLIAVDKVLTAFHCVRNANLLLKTKVRLWSGPVIGVKLVKSKVGWDLAILQLENPIPEGSGRPVPLAIDVLPGDPVIMIGAPDGEPFVVSRGWVAKVEKEVAYPKDPCNPTDKLGLLKHQIITLDIRGWYGNSGGGLFDDQANFIGVLVRGQSIDNGVCDPLLRIDYSALFLLGVGIDTVRTFLTTDPGDSDPPAPPTSE